MDSLSDLELAMNNSLAVMKNRFLDVPLATANKDIARDRRRLIRALLWYFAFAVGICR